MDNKKMAGVKGTAAEVEVEAEEEIPASRISSMALQNVLHPRYHQDKVSRTEAPSELACPKMPNLQQATKRRRRMEEMALKRWRLRCALSAHLP